MVDYEGLNTALNWTDRVRLQNLTYAVRHSSGAICVRYRGHTCVISYRQGIYRICLPAVSKGQKRGFCNRIETYSPVKITSNEYGYKLRIRSGSEDTANLVVGTVWSDCYGNLITPDYWMGGCDFHPDTPKLVAEQCKEDVLRLIVSGDDNERLTTVRPARAVRVLDAFDGLEVEEEDASW